MRLYKTTIEILSDYDPSETELSDLARDAECGDSYCLGQTTVQVDSTTLDPSVREFFEPLEDLEYLWET